MLAFGRDYADVAPVDGVIVTFGEQKLEVKVDVVPFGGPAHAVFDRGGERP